MQIFQETFLLKQSALFFMGLTALICTLTACSSGDASVFEGTWVSTKNPEDVWKIEKQLGGFVGTRMGTKGFYDFDTETWKANFKQKGVMRLVPKNKNGTTLSYLRSQGTDKIIRHPPGVVYERMPSEEK